MLSSAIPTRLLLGQLMPLEASVTSVAARRFFATVEETNALSVAKNLIVDTLQVVKGFEQVGLSRKQAETLTRQVTELLCINKDRAAEQYVAKNALDKIILEQEAKIASFKNELIKGQDVHVATVNKDLERQENFLDKMRSEVRHEIDKLTASQRLDLNLEKGRMRDELQALRDKTTELEIKVDREINELKATVEKAKNDVIKSVVALLGTFSAIAFTISRFVQMGHG